jgi:hypothetical protein
MHNIAIDSLKRVGSTTTTQSSVNVCEISSPAGKRNILGCLYYPGGTIKDDDGLTLSWMEYIQEIQNPTLSKANSNTISSLQARFTTSTQIKESIEKLKALQEEYRNPNLSDSDRVMLESSFHAAMQGLQSYAGKAYSSDMSLYDDFIENVKAWGSIAITDTANELDKIKETVCLRGLDPDLLDIQTENTTAGIGNFAEIAAAQVNSVLHQFWMNQDLQAAALYYPCSIFDFTPRKLHAVSALLKGIS